MSSDVEGMVVVAIPVRIGEDITKDVPSKEPDKMHRKEKHPKKCPKCGSKVIELEYSFICEKCDWSVLR